MEKFTIASDTKGNTVWNGPHGEEGADQGLIDYVLFHDYNNSRIEVVQTHIVRSIEINGAIFCPVSAYTSICSNGISPCMQNLSLTPSK